MSSDRVRALCCFLTPTVVSLACSTGPDADACDFADITLTVSQAPQLSFSWTPRSCGAFELQVTQGTPIIWLVSTQAVTNDLHPPIRYGQLPDGAIGPPAPALTPGIAYFVILHRANFARTEVLSDTVQFVHSPPD